MLLLANGSRGDRHPAFAGTSAISYRPRDLTIG
jgi:hypothetical protein